MKRISRANLNRYPAAFVTRALSLATIEEGDIVAVSEDTFAQLMQELPSLAAMASSASSAMLEEGRAILSGVPSITEDESDRRRAICAACPFYRIEDRHCSQCGCFIEWKTRMRTQHCPDSLW